MMTRLLIFLMVFGLSISSFGQQDPQASPPQGREFITSVIYGTLAGTLVGVASLAFTANPGGNLNNVARGASYGLYAGILLGAYVTYGVDDEEPETKQGPSLYEGENPDGQLGPDSPRPDGSSLDKEYPPIALAPVFENQSVSGATVNYIFRF